MVQHTKSRSHIGQTSRKASSFIGQGQHKNPKTGYIPIGQKVYVTMRNNEPSIEARIANTAYRNCSGLIVYWCVRTDNGKLFTCIETRLVIAYDIDQ